MQRMNRLMKMALVAMVIGGSVCMAAEDKRDATLYSGMKSCRMCHKKEASGNQYQKWVDGPHSKTFEILASDEAKKIGAKLGVADPQKSEKCLKCHSTAYNWGTKPVTEKITPEEGVTCESCHGPGKNYKSKSVMKDRAACIENGMIYPATKSCVKCHNEESATWNPERYTTKDGKKVGFDVEQAYKKIQHPNPNLHK